MSEHVFGTYVEKHLRKAELFTFKQEPGDLRYQITLAPKGRQFIQDTLATYHVVLNEVDQEVNVSPDLELA